MTFTARTILVAGTVLLTFGQVREKTSLTATLVSVRALDFSAMPTRANRHPRTKWSRGLYIVIDDELTPSLYVFNRSGKQVFTATLQLPQADSTRVEDFAAAPDGSIWLCVQTHTGKQSNVLAHVTSDGQNLQIFQTTPYRPLQLAVASDNTVWTVGEQAAPLRPPLATKVSNNQDVLRHFDDSGKLLSSQLPTAAFGNFTQTGSGYLAASDDRVTLLSPPTGGGEYGEFLPATNVSKYYPPVPGDPSKDFAESFVLTPEGNTFVVIFFSNGGAANTRILYKLDRAAMQWVPVRIPEDPMGAMVLEGNDGEALILMDPMDNSKLNLFQVGESQPK